MQLHYCPALFRVTHRFSPISIHCARR